MSNFAGKQRKLVDALIRQDNSGQLTWELGLAGKSVFTILNSGRLELSWDTDENDQEAVRVSLFDTAGNLSLTFDDLTLMYVDTFTEEKIYYFSRMEDLINSAFVKARGEDKVLDDFLKDLD